MVLLPSESLPSPAAGDGPSVASGETS